MSRADPASRRARLLLRDGTDWSALGRDEFIEANRRATERLSSPAARLVLGRPDRRARIEDREHDLAGRTVALRLHRPRGRTEPLPLILSFHGGGFVAGTAAQDDWLNSFLAVACSAAVIAVEYRLAPVAPLPAAFEDGHDALRAVLRQPDAFGVDPDRVALFGESAGGTIAATTAHRAAREGTAIAALALAYPVVDWSARMDDPDHYPSVTEASNHPGLTLSRLRAARRWSVPAGLDAAVASPAAHTDVGQLPPTLIQVGTADIVRDHGLRYAGLLRAAGVETHSIRYPRTTHGFFSTPGVNGCARRARTELATFLSRHLQRRHRVAPPGVRQ